MSEHLAEFDYTLADRLRSRWWSIRHWFRRCPECRRRGYGEDAPRWESDPVAQMLGIAQYGCRTCGNGAVEQRNEANVDQPERCPSRDPYDGFLRCQRRAHADDRCQFDGIAWTKTTAPTAEEKIVPRPTVCPGDDCNAVVTDPDDNDGFCPACTYDGAR